MTTSIQWTDETWNPVTGCRKVSPGCKNCYAEGVADRFWATQYPPVPCPQCGGSGRWAQGGVGIVECPRCVGIGKFERRFTDVQVHPDRLAQPLRWRKPRRVFVNSMSDLFHEDVPAQFIVEVFAVMAAASRHTFQVLTKRPERMRDILAELDRETVARRSANAVENYPDALWDQVMFGPWPLPNVWLGVSVEDQERADERIPLIIDTPAAVRFLSCEPLLGPVDLPLGPYRLPNGCDLRRGGRVRLSTDHAWTIPEAARRTYAIALDDDAASPGSEVVTRPSGIDWLIVGGESGPKARPMDLAWARSLVEQGRDAGVPVFCKQMGAVWARAHGASDRHGGLIEEFPPDLQVRDLPEVRHAHS